LVKVDAAYHSNGARDAALNLSQKLGALHSRGGNLVEVLACKHRNGPCSLLVALPWLCSHAFHQVPYSILGGLLHGPCLALKVNQDDSGKILSCGRGSMKGGFTAAFKDARGGGFFRRFDKSFGGLFRICKRRGWIVGDFPQGLNPCLQLIGGLDGIAARLDSCGGGLEIGECGN
jgi:hypothetical protein